MPPSLAKPHQQSITIQVGMLSLQKSLRSFCNKVLVGGLCTPAISTHWGSPNKEEIEASIVKVSNYAIMQKTSIQAPPQIHKEEYS